MPQKRHLLQSFALSGAGAAEHASLFRVMFGPHLSDKTAYPSLQATAQAAYHTIEERLERCGPLGGGPSAHTEHLAVASWAVIHGLAMLLIDRQFGLANSVEAERMARQVTDVVWVGLSNYGAGLASGSSA